MAIGSGAFCPGLGRVHHEHFVAGVLRRRSGQRQRLEQRHRRARQRHLARRADLAGHEHAARLELVDLDADLRVLDVVLLQQRA